MKPSCDSIGRCSQLRRVQAATGPKFKFLPVFLASQPLGHEFSLPAEPATEPQMSHQCKHCANLSVSALVDLAKADFAVHTFPDQAFYRHHSSFDKLESSGDNGCDFCRLVLECFKRTPTKDDEPTYWPSEWVGPEDYSEDSMYTIAKKLPISDVKLCISSAAMYSTDPLAKASMLDTVMVQVGPKSSEDEEYDEIWGLPPLLLTLSTPRGKFSTTLFFV